MPATAKERRTTLVENLLAPLTLLPRLALSKLEAAQSIGVSIDYLEEHVLPELRCVRRGRRRLIPVEELSRWVDRTAEMPQ
jgi:hypothetical protein